MHKFSFIDRRDIILVLKLAECMVLYPHLIHYIGLTGKKKSYKQKLFCTHIFQYNLLKFTENIQFKNVYDVISIRQWTQITRDEIKIRLGPTLRMWVLDTNHRTKILGGLFWDKILKMDPRLLMMVWFCVKRSVTGKTYMTRTF